MEYKSGDLVWIRDGVTKTQNSNIDLLKNRMLVVNHYHNSIDEPITLMVNIVGDSAPLLYLVSEEQINLAQ